MEPSPGGAAGPRMYAGLFLVTLATLMYEVLLTRIFSVTMWYHFAFMAISTAMFGMTMGALLVHLVPDAFRREDTRRRLASSTLWMAITVVLSFMTQLCIPFVIQRSLVGLYSAALTFAVVSVPFVFSGISVCLALTRFPRQVSRLYAADLAGAALGCLLLILALEITDGPTAVFVVATIASLGALCFATDSGPTRSRRVALVTTLLLATFTGILMVQVNRQRPLVRLLWVKGALETPPAFQKWNSFSRIAIWDHADTPFGWGIKVMPPGLRIKQMGLNIDASAGTVITGFNGDLGPIEYLKYDVTNLAHYLRPGSKVLVVGTGGGRDILSALAFHQPEVVGVEINNNIIDALNGRYGAFSGHLDRRPGVRFVNDEARSYIARSADRFDILQVSLIDTWAATSAGAFVLSENSLYTREAWELFIAHLRPRGILTFSRWYVPQSPAEMYRLVSLACAALRRVGVSEPRQHLLVARCVREHQNALEPDGVGTLILSREPLSEGDVEAWEQACRKLECEMVFSPRTALDPTYAELAAAPDLDRFAANSPLDISPPTDDRPFFFNMLRIRDCFRRGLMTQGTNSWNLSAVYILGALLTIVTVLTALCIVLPLALTRGFGSLAGAGPLLLFFIGIGCGFMLIEVSQMQRLIVFLGHPTYGLSVVLFSLLVSSSLGSWLTERSAGVRWARGAMVRLALLIGVLVLFGLATPIVIRAAGSMLTPIRIVVAIAMLFPLGLFMGMAFPLGMKLAGERAATLTPWFWGVNGGTSVFASVLAVVIAIAFGISETYWTGVGSYLGAIGAFVWARRAGG